MLACDDVARTLLSGEIPLGILTSFVGALFFLGVVMGRRRCGRERGPALAVRASRSPTRPEGPTCPARRLARGRRRAPSPRCWGPTARARRRSSISSSAGSSHPGDDRTRGAGPGRLSPKRPQPERRDRSAGRTAGLRTQRHRIRFARPGPTSRSWRCRETRTAGWPGRPSKRRELGPSQTFGDFPERRRAPAGHHRPPPGPRSGDPSPRRAHGPSRHRQHPPDFPNPRVLESGGQDRDPDGSRSQSRRGIAASPVILLREVAPSGRRTGRFRHDPG